MYGSRKLPTLDRVPTRFELAFEGSPLSLYRQHCMCRKPQGLLSRVQLLDILYQRAVQSQRTVDEGVNVQMMADCPQIESCASGNESLLVRWTQSVLLQIFHDPRATTAGQYEEQQKREDTYLCGCHH